MRIWPFPSRFREDPYRKGKLPFRALFLLAILSLCVLLVLEAAKIFRPDAYRTEKAAARDSMRFGMQVLKAERWRLGIPIDPAIDPAGTGLIGEAYNDLTTTIGSLASKRTSANPEFAAVIVDMLGEAGARSGDFVAVSFSGSFPALNLAVLSAVRAMELKPVIISSVGASMYGANLPGLTWLDMERILREQGLLPYRSIAASLGGIADTKGGLDGTGIESGLLAIRRNGVPLLEEGTEPLQTDIRRRLELYNREISGRKPAAFINVGGPSTSLGNVPGADRMPVGLWRKIPAVHEPDRGMLFLMGERGVPVIHLLKIGRIAARYGIAFDPLGTETLWSAGAAGRGRYSKSIALAGLAVLLFAMGFLVRKNGCSIRIRREGNL